jgi:transposase
LQIKLLEAEADKALRVYYFDAAGFNTIPCVPYAWQKKSQTIEIPSQRSKQLNILGFMNKDNDCFFYPQEGKVTSETVIAAFEAFGRRYVEHYLKTRQPCVVIVDNAPVHTSRQFLKKIDSWCSYGLMIHFLPTYSPELNLIEILWRKIKYEWISFNAYQSYENLKGEVLDILSQLGRKYTITFS